MSSRRQPRSVSPIQGRSRNFAYRQNAQQEAEAQAGAPQQLQEQVAAAAEQVDDLRNDFINVFHNLLAGALDMDAQDAFVLATSMPGGFALTRAWVRALGRMEADHMQERADADEENANLRRQINRLQISLQHSQDESRRLEIELQNWRSLSDAQSAYRRA